MNRFPNKLNLNRRAFLKKFALQATLAATAGTGMFGYSSCVSECQRKGGTNKPNVIILLADDLGYGDLGCFGNNYIKTPNINRLALEGVKLTNFYSDSPVCTPTRASIMTGRCPQRNGLTNVIETEDRFTHLGSSEVLLPEILKKNGYSTGLIGKWHIGEPPGARPNDRGYDYFFGALQGGINYFSHEFGKRGNILMENNRLVGYPETYITDLIAKKSEDFIEKNIQNPFFLLVSFFSPHTAIDSEGKFGMLQATTDQLALYTSGEVPTRKQKYAAMVSSLDAAVGKIMKTLKRNNLNKSTFVFFTSDNGPDPYPYYSVRPGSTGPLRGYKHTLWEGGIRVPAIAKWPGKIPSSEVRESCAITSDLAPTILSITSTKQPASLLFDGIDITPIFINDQIGEKRMLFWSYIRDTKRVSCEKAVRSGDWKWLNGELYNLKNDPGERHNLADRYPQIALELELAWNKWLKQFPKELKRWKGREPVRFIEPWLK